MEIRLTDHARREMEYEEIRRDDLEHIIEQGSVIPGQTADQYDAVIRGTHYRLFVVKGSTPPLVITLFSVRE